MKIESFKPADVFAICQADELATGVIEIERSPVRIRDHDDVGGRFQDRGETSVGGFGALALADLALEGVDLFG